MSRTTTEVIGGEIVETRGNPLLGVVGAVCGALLGAALWVALYQFGIIASIAGIAIVYCACKGYALFSKSESVGGVVTSVLISVVVLAAAHFLCWGLFLYNGAGAGSAVTLWDALLAVPTVALSEELVIDFAADLLIGLILIGVGAAPFLRQAIHNRAR